MYLSANGIVEPGDPSLTELAIGPLAPGASVTSTATITIPQNTTGGTYYLFAVADANDTELESAETNNLLVRDPESRARSGGHRARRPAHRRTGRRTQHQFDDRQTGGGDAGAFAVTFYLSSNYILDASDILLSGTRTFTSLAAGTSSAGTTDVTIPAGTAVGTYLLIAKADGNDQIVEALESNNTSPRTIQIGGDLVVSALTAPAMAGAGTVIVVTETTTNQGTATVAASTTRFYLSTNWQWDAGDTELNGSHVVPQLGASGTSTATTSLTIPAGTVSGA